MNIELVSKLGSLLVHAIKSFSYQTVSTISTTYTNNDTMSKVMSDQQEWINDHWEKYDTDGSGEINQIEFRTLVNDVLAGFDLGSVDTWMPVDKVFRDFDKDGSGLINRDEATRLVGFCWAWARVFEEWKTLGKSEDDALSSRQFRVFARKFLDVMGFDADWRRIEFDALMETYDADGDGEIDRDEALTFLYEFAGCQGSWFSKPQEASSETEIHL